MSTVPLLQELIGITRAKKAGDGWLGRCPAHDDKQASLSITEAGGKTLTNCHAGCTWEQVRDAFKALHVELSGGTADRGWETVWTIRDRAGKAIAQHVRVDKPEGKIVFWRGPNGEKAGLKELGVRVVDLPLYGIHELADGPVFVCEGEKAADALRKLGIAAVGTVTGAAAVPSRTVLADLKGRSVVLWPDNDEPGRKHMQGIAQALTELAISHKILSWPDAPAKGDAADFRGPKADVLALLKSKLVLPTMADGIREASEELDRYESGDFSDRIQTGIPKLDRRLRGGLKGGQLTLLGAPTGGGKTTIVQMLASEAAKRGPVLFVTPEMSLAELAEREIVRRSGSPMWDRNPWQTPEVVKEKARRAHMSAEAKIAKERLPLFVLDRPDLTMLDVEDAATQIEGLVLVVIDYAQQVADVSDHRKARYLQVGEVGTRGVMLAEKLKVPVVVASQVNVVKDGGEREFRFRETQVLEHKAHNVLIFDVEWETGETRKVRSAKFICTKQRSGQAFTLPVKYEPELYRVMDEPAPWEERAGAPRLAALPYADA